jgi:hypothetical protein
MRTSSAALLLLVTACSSGASEVAPPDPDDLIECALAGAASFARDCAVERSEEEAGLILVVRHPDGGFRRFEVLTDGRGLASADGADRAQIAVHGTGVDSGIEVAVGADRYRFPATIAGDDRP